MQAESTRRDLVVLSLFCAILSLGIGFELFRAEDGALLGSGHTDGLGSYWFQWFVAHRLETGGSLFRTDLWFHPWGIDLLNTYGGNIVDPILSLPFRALGGPIWAWNGLVLLLLFANGMAAGTWIGLRNGSLWAGLAAATVTISNPVLLYEIGQGRPAQAILFPLIGAIGLFEAATKSETKKRSLGLAAGAGFLIGIAGYCYWYGGLFAALGVMVLGLGRDWKPRLVCLAVAGLGCIVTVSPLLFDLLETVGSGAHGALLPVGDWWNGELSLLTAANDEITLCTLDSSGQAAKTLRGERLIGAPLLGGVAILSLLVCARGAWRFALMALVGIVIALGPLPGGIRNPIYLSLAALPGMDRLYWPCRAVVLTIPTVALAAGILPQLVATRYRRFAFFVLPSLAVLESLARGTAPLETWRADTPQSLRCIANTSGAVISLPYGRDHVHLLHQTVHERPLLGGGRETSRSLVPNEQRDWLFGNEEHGIEPNGWLADLMTTMRNPRHIPSWTEADRDEISEHDYRWVVLRWDLLPRTGPPEGRVSRENQRERAFADFLGDPVLVDGDLRVYAPWGDELDCPQGSTSD